MASSWRTSLVRVAFLMAGCVVEAAEGEEPSDALLGGRVSEDAPDVWGNAPGPPKAARGVGADV